MVNFLNSTNAIYNSVLNVIDQIAKGLTENILLFASFGVLFVIMAIAYLATRFSYEKRMIVSIKRLNRFLSKNPQVTEDNLVELNDRMKMVPKTLRIAWQEYMLNRDKFPSEYMNNENCIEQPSKISGYRTAVALCSIFVVISALFVGLMIFARIISRTGIDTSGIFTIYSLYEVFFLPVLMVFIGYLWIAFLKARYTAIMADLYYEFHEFQKFINKSCQTMPPFIDYEILFTQKEIREGITVLQNYLEKKSLQEQKEKEEEELNNSKFEKFEFNELGVESAILLDRAMLESEKYFNVKRNMTERVTSKEQEIYNFSKNFDEVTKDFERKSQSHRENMTQLNEQLNQTTIKIEANYIKKRYNEEQQKLQQLEKDYDLATSRFKKQQAELEGEVKALNDEIENRKSHIEKIMLEEGKAYANKIYGIISDIIDKQNAPKFSQMEEERVALESEIENMKQTLKSQEIEINTKQNHIDILEKDLSLKLSQIEAIENVKEYFSSSEFRQRVMGKNADEFADVDELRVKLLYAEEQLIIANERYHAYVGQENEMLNKLKELEQNQAELRKENESLKYKRKGENKLAELQEKIGAENKKYIDNSKELKETVENISSTTKVKPATIETLSEYEDKKPNNETPKEEVNKADKEANEADKEESVEEESKARLTDKKARLASLLDATNKLKK